MERASLGHDDFRRVGACAVRVDQCIGPRILPYVAQISIYLPDDVARRLRSAARRAKKSLSAYLTELASGGCERRTWPKWFLDLQGSCRGTLKAPDDPPPEEPEGL